MEFRFIDVRLDFKQKFLSRVSFFLDGSFEYDVAKELRLDGFFLDHGGFLVLVSDGISDFLKSSLSVIMSGVDFNGF